LEFALSPPFFFSSQTLLQQGFIKNQAPSFPSQGIYNADRGVFSRRVRIAEPSSEGEETGKPILNSEFLRSFFGKEEWISRETSKFRRSRIDCDSMIGLFSDHLFISSMEAVFEVEKHKIRRFLE